MKGERFRLRKAKDKEVNSVEARNSSASSSDFQHLRKRRKFNSVSVHVLLRPRILNVYALCVSTPSGFSNRLDIMICVDFGTCLFVG